MPAIESNMQKMPLILYKVIDTWNQRVDEFNNIQPGFLFRMMAVDQLKVLFISNIYHILGNYFTELKNCHIVNCLIADSAYGQRVAGELGIMICCGIPKLESCKPGG